jgi:hypothetical protein
MQLNDVTVKINYYTTEYRDSKNQLLNKKKTRKFPFKKNQKLIFIFTIFQII